MFPGVLPLGCYPEKCYPQSKTVENGVPWCVTVEVLPGEVLPAVKNRRKWCSPFCYPRSNVAFLCLQ